MEVKVLYDTVDRKHYENGYATTGSVGLDLLAHNFAGNLITGKMDIQPGTTLKVGTGIALNMTMAESSNEGINIGAIILPRSGLGSKHGIVLANTVGLIDTDYQGELFIVLRNTGSETYCVKPQERIAQLCFVPFIKPMLTFVKEFSNETERGSGGFGSTGR